MDQVDIKNLLCSNDKISAELAKFVSEAKHDSDDENKNLHGLENLNLGITRSHDLLSFINMYKKKNENSFKDRIELESHQNMLAILQESKDMFTNKDNYEVIVECKKDGDGKCVYEGVDEQTKKFIDKYHNEKKLDKPITLLYQKGLEYPIVYYDSTKVKYAYDTKTGTARNMAAGVAIAGLMAVGSLLSKYASGGASSAADTIGDAIDPEGLGKVYTIDKTGKKPVMVKKRDGELLGTTAVAYVGKKTINQFVSIHDQMVNPLSEDASTFFKLRLLLENCSCSKNINDTTTLEHNLMKARTEIKYTIIPKLIKVIFIGIILGAILYFTGGFIAPILLGIAKKLFVKDMNKGADNVGMMGLTYIIKTIVVTIIGGLLYAVGKSISYALYKIFPSVGQRLTNIYNKVTYIFKKLATVLDNIWTPNKYKILLNSLDINSIKNDISNIDIPDLSNNKIYNEFIISKIDEWSIGEGFELAIDDDHENILTNTIQASFAENNLNQIIKETKDQFLETLFEAINTVDLSEDQHSYLIGELNDTDESKILSNIKINFRDCNEQNPTKSKSHLYLKLYSTFYNILLFSYTTKSIVYTTPGKENDITNNITSEIKSHVQTIAFKLAKMYTEKILAMALYDILHENKVKPHPFNVLEKPSNSQKDQIIADYNEGIAGITYNIGSAENTTPKTKHFDKKLSKDKLKKFYQSYIAYVHKLIYYKPYDARKIFANLNDSSKKSINDEIMSGGGNREDMYENGDYIFETINGHPCITPRKVFVDERLFTGVDYEELYNTQLLDFTRSIYDKDLNTKRADLISKGKLPDSIDDSLDNLRTDCETTQTDSETTQTDSNTSFKGYSLLTIDKDGNKKHKFISFFEIIRYFIKDKEQFTWTGSPAKLKSDTILKEGEITKNDFVVKNNDSFYRIKVKLEDTSSKYSITIKKNDTILKEGEITKNDFQQKDISLEDSTGKEIIDEFIKYVKESESNLNIIVILNNRYYLYSKLLSNHKQLDEESPDISSAYSSGESPFKNSIGGLFNSDNIMNEIEIFVDSYYTENFIEIYTDGLLDLIYKRDNMFNNYYLNDECMEFKVRIFKYYELRSINNFVGKYFPEILKRFETAIIDGTTDCHTKGIKKTHQSAYIEAKCEYLATDLKDFKTVHPQLRKSNQDYYREMLDIDSINRIYGVIILFYNRYVETLKFSQKYSSIKYYLYSTSYNDGLVYNFNPYYHLYYDIFTYSKYLYNYTGSSSGQNNNILNHFHKKVFTMVFQPEILLLNESKNNIIQLALFYNKFNINHVFSSNNLIIDSFNNDGIFGSGERLYSESKIVNLNRTSFTNTELYNRLNNKYWLYYDVNKDRINIIINGKIDEFIEPISQGSNNTLAYRLSVKNDVMSFIDNFVDIHINQLKKNLVLNINDELFHADQLNNDQYKYALKIYFMHKIIKTYSSLNTSSTETFINSNKTVLFRFLDISPFGGRDTLNDIHNEDKSSDYSMIIFALKYLIFHWFFMDKEIGSDVRTSKFQHLSHVVLGMDMHEQIKDFYLFKSGKLFTNHFYIEKNGNNEYVLKMVVSKHLSVLNSAYDTSNTYYNNALYEKREINKGIFKHNFDGSPLEQNVFDYIQTNFEIKLNDIHILASGIGETVKSRNYYTQSWKSFKLFYPKYITQTNSKINITEIDNISNKIFKKSMNKLYYILKNYTINKIPTDDIYLNTSVKLSHNIDSTHKIEISSEIFKSPDDIQSYYETLLTKIDTFIGCNKINGDVGRLLYNTLILGKVIDTNFSFEPQIAYFSSINDYYDLKALPQKLNSDDNYFITRYSKALKKFRELVYGKSKNEHIDIHISGHQTGGSYSIMVLYHLIYDMIKMKKGGNKTTPKYNQFIRESLMMISKIKIYSLGSTKDFNYTASILLDFIEEIINLDTSYNYTPGTTVLNVINFHDPIPKIPKIRFHIGSLYIIDSKVMNFTSKYLIELEKNIYPYLEDKSNVAKGDEDNAYNSMLNYVEGVEPKFNVKLDFSKLVSIYLKDSRFKHISKIKKLEFLLKTLKDIVNNSHCKTTSSFTNILCKLDDIFKNSYITSYVSRPDPEAGITIHLKIVNALYNSFMTGEEARIPIAKFRQVKNIILEPKKKEYLDLVQKCNTLRHYKIELTQLKEEEYPPQSFEDLFVPSEHDIRYKNYMKWKKKFEEKKATDIETKTKDIAKIKKEIEEYNNLVIPIYKDMPIIDKKKNEINEQIYRYIALLIEIYNQINIEDKDCFKINMDLYKNIRKNPFIVNPVILTDLQSKLFNRRPDIFITEPTQSLLHQIKFITEKSGYLNDTKVAPKDKNYEISLDNRIDLDQASVFNKDNGLEYTTIDRSPVRTPDYMNILETGAQLSDMSTIADIQYGNDYSYTPYLLSSLPIYQMLISKLYHDEKFIRDLRKIQKNIHFSFELKDNKLRNFSNTNQLSLIITDEKNRFNNFMKVLANPGIFLKEDKDNFKMINTFFSKRIYDTVIDSRINISDDELQRIVRKKYTGTVSYYYPSLNNTRNLFCFDTKNLKNKCLTKVEEIIEFILCLGRYLGLFFEEFEFRHNTYTSLKEHVNNVKNNTNLSYRIFDKTRLHLINIVKEWDTKEVKERQIKEKGERNDRLKELKDVMEKKNKLKEQLMEEREKIEKEANVARVVGADKLEQLINEINQLKSDLKKLKEDLMNDRYGEAEAQIKLNILITFTKYLIKLGYIDNFVPVNAYTYQESYEKSIAKIKAMLDECVKDKDSTEGDKIFNKIISELNGIDLFNITCMTADNFPCNYNMFNNNNSLSKSISIHKYYKITFNRDNNEFDNIEKHEASDYGYKRIIGIEVLEDTFDYNCGINPYHYGINSEKKNMNIKFQSSRFDIKINDPNWTPYQKYIIEFNKILGKFVYNKDTEYDKYFKGDILHTTLYHAKLNNLTVLSNKKSPKFTSVHESELNQVDTEGDSDELEAAQNILLELQKERTAVTTGTAAVNNLSVISNTGVPRGDEEKEDVYTTTSVEKDLSNLSYLELQDLCMDTKEQTEGKCRCNVKQDTIVNCLKAYQITPEEGATTVSKGGGGSLSCCKKDCDQNREEGSFFCMNHSINSISNNKQQSHDFIFN